MNHFLPSLYSRKVSLRLATPRKRNQPETAENRTKENRFPQMYKTSAEGSPMNARYERFERPKANVVTIKKPLRRIRRRRNFWICAVCPSGG